MTLAAPLRKSWNPWARNENWLDKIETEFGRPDIIHFHGVYYPFQTSLARQCRKREWKYVVSVHGGLEKLAQRSKLLKKALGNFTFHDSFIKEAEAVHVLNEAEWRSAQAKYPGVKTFVIPNGVSSDIFLMPQAVRPKTSSISRPLKVGFIGRIDVKQKGLDFLLRAIKLFEMRHPKADFQIILVGPFHTLKDKIILMWFLSSMKSPRKVVLAGSLKGKDKWEMLSNFDVFIHTSRYEGMPGAVIEAMAFQLPCILTPATNMQGVIRECEGGWACDATPEAIAETLREVEADRNEILRRGRNAREYVQQHLTWDVIAVDYFHQISRLAKG